MSDPGRMLEGTTGADDELALELLRAGKAEEPSERARQRAMAAAGITSAAAATTIAAAATTATAAEASLHPAAAKAGSSVAGLVVKWVGIAAVGGLGLWGAWQVATPDAATSEASAGLAEPFSRVATELPEGAMTPSTEGHAAGAETPPAAVDSEPAAVVAGPTQEAPAPSTSGDLVDEVAAIDRARAAMDDDPEAALAELEEYQRRFSGGALAQEAEVLRIESLARSGRDEQAHQAAESFLANHPDSPLAARVRAVLGTSGATP